MPPRLRKRFEPLPKLGGVVCVGAAVPHVEVVRAGADHLIGDQLAPAERRLIDHEAVRFGPTRKVHQVFNPVQKVGISG